MSLPSELTTLCANPDHLVERGHNLVYCAGALAQIYEEDGGKVTYAGKPYKPIYELAEETIARLAGRKVARSEILAIGDGIRTDMAGAAEFGLDSRVRGEWAPCRARRRGARRPPPSPSCSRAAKPTRRDAGAARQLDATQESLILQCNKGFAIPRRETKKQG